MDLKTKNLENCAKKTTQKENILWFSVERVQRWLRKKYLKGRKNSKISKLVFLINSFRNNEISQNQKQRIDIIKNFKEANIDAISAIKILDEGIDVPSITAYILASSNNRRQFVQRRGRF